MEDEIFAVHFTFSNGNRIHKSDVQSIFNKYKPISMKALVKFLSTKNIEYYSDLRCPGDKKKGIFIGIDLKETSSSDRESIQQKAKTVKSLELEKYKTEEIGYDGKKLSEATIKMRRDRLKKLDSLNIDYSDFDDIIEKVVKESKSLSTRILSLKSILWRLWLAKNEDIELKDKLIKARNEWKNEYDAERCKNELNEKEDKNWVEWRDVIKRRDEIKNIKDKLILGLYTYQVPRRVEDYVNMYWVEKLDEEDEKEDRNYCVGYKRFVFNKYKTSNTYGRQSIIIHPDLVNILKKYVNKYEIEDGDRLLGCRSNAVISDTLKDIFDKNVSVNILRKSFISYIDEKVRAISTEDREKIARMMGHSVQEASRYLKIDTRKKS